MHPLTEKIAKTVEAVVTNKYFLSVGKYIVILLVVIFGLSKSLDYLPNSILNHIPFTSSSQYLKVKKSLDLAENRIKLRDSVIAKNQAVIDSLNFKSYVIETQISNNKKKIKSVGKNINGLDSLLNSCGCL